MSPSKNTRSDFTISTEVTTIPTLTSPYMTQTDFNTTIAKTIKYLLANFYDKHAKKYAKFKEAIEDNISEQDAKVDATFENNLKTL